MRTWHAVFCFWLFCQAGVVLLTAFDPALHRYWEAVIIQPVWPPFGDLRVVLKAWILDSQGVDPLAADVAQASFNYPRLWLLPGRLGVSPGHYRWLGVGLVSVFLVCVAMLTRRCGKSALLASWLFSLSGAWWLGMERGNTDLLIFSLMFLSLALLDGAGRAKSAGAWGLLLCSVLKLFPGVLLPLLLGAKGERGKTATRIIFVLFAIYLLATLPDVLQILRKTSRGDAMSYGVPIAVRFFSYFWFGGAEPGAGLLLGSQAVVAGAVLGAACWGWSRLSLPDLPSRSELRFFLAGAALFVFSFLFQTNWAYRLSFLIFVFPALGTWLGATEGKFRLVAASVMLLCVATPWALSSRSVAVIMLGHASSLALALVLALLVAASGRSFWRAGKGVSYESSAAGTSSAELL